MKYTGRFLPLLASLLIVACGGSGGGGDSVVTTPPPPPEPPAAPAESTARAWNEQVLNAIRNDFARPTVHARNLWHTAAAMYDAWAAYSATSTPYLLGRQVGDFTCGLDSFGVPDDIAGARAQAISHAAYRIMQQRFASSPGATDIMESIDAQMQQFGYNAGDTSLDYHGGSAAALGNYIADCYLRFGLQDGANEVNDYANTAYAPVNPPIFPEDPGNPDIVDLDRWQPITLSEFIDQSGNVIADQPEFLSPEWGQLVPFALTDADRTTYQRDGFDYHVYHDPGPPPFSSGPSATDYKWGFSMVAVWSAHLSPDDGIMIDISPASIGNNPALPMAFPDYD